MNVTMIWLIADDTNEPFSPLIAGVVIVSACVLLLLTFNWFARRRARAWRKYADERGLPYAAEDRATRNRLLDFASASRGRERKLLNVITIDLEGVALLVGDYNYYVARYDHEQKLGSFWAQTVCVVLEPGTEAPDFLLKSRGVGRFDPLSMSPPTEVTFEDLPEFSQKFVVQGDADAVSRFFTADLRRAILDRTSGPFVAEVCRGALLVHRGNRIKPADCEELAAFASGFVQILQTPYP